MDGGFNFNNGKESTRRHDARSQGTQYGNVLRTLRRSTSRVAREGQSVASGSRGIDRRFAEHRVALGNRRPATELGAISEDRRSVSTQTAQGLASVKFLRNNTKTGLKYIDVIPTWYYTGYRQERRSPSEIFDRPGRRRVLA